jgi:hypothetical protein
VYILDGINDNGTVKTVELYSPSTGGTILPTKIVSDILMAAVAIGLLHVCGFRFLKFLFYYKIKFEVSVLH